MTSEPGEIDRLQAICARLSPKFLPERIIARQACFRPVTEDGLPLIGKVPQIEGAYVATGHSVWGILNAPATGEALAELIADGVAGTSDLVPSIRPVSGPSTRAVSLGTGKNSNLLRLRELLFPRKIRRHGQARK